MSDWALKTDTRYGKLPFAWARLNVTVFGSVATADPFAMTPLIAAVPAVPIRSIVATTSSAVKSEPSCHFTPLRRLKTQTELSAFGVHFSASPGAMFVASGASVHRNSKLWAVMPYEARSCIAIVSSVTGFWHATLIEPPVLTAVVVEPPGAGLPAAPEAPGAVALAAVGPPHAALSAVMDVIVRPSNVPRRTNSRRVIFPRANDSTAWSFSVVVERRTSSSLR